VKKGEGGGGKQKQREKMLLKREKKDSKITLSNRSRRGDRIPLDGRQHQKKNLRPEGRIETSSHHREKNKNHTLYKKICELQKGLHEKSGRTKWFVTGKWLVRENRALHPSKRHREGY